MLIKKPVKKSILKKAPKMVERHEIVAKTTKKPKIKKFVVPKKAAVKKVAATPKKTVASKLNELMICNAIDNLKGFVIVQSDDLSVLVARKVGVSINAVNENSIFQPHEHVVKRAYCALVILEFKPSPLPKDCYWKDHEYLKRIGCPCFTIKHIDEVKHILEGLD